SALFISCRDLFVGDRYELVCRLHTKKSPQVAAVQGNLFKRHLFENLLNSPGYTSNVIDMFHDNPCIGVAVPPLVHISYPTMGHVWFGNRPRAEELAALLDIRVPFDQDTPVGAFGTMFWFRPKALRKLFAHPWKWTDFNAEPGHVDGGLAHVLERLICYAAQDARYTTQQILSARHAGWNYAMLEWKLQKLSSMMPNGEFNHQCSLLEQWKHAGFPISSTGSYGPLGTSTVRRAWSEFLLSIKRSIAFRFPRTFRVLRPAYRTVTRRGR
uniref:rhamnan synthesis F family protein n=1 Tax=Caballeronia sp. AZ7_KS35 TaxID=2921762 RepID=UPI0020289329